MSDAVIGLFCDEAASGQIRQIGAYEASATFIAQ